MKPSHKVENPEKLSGIGVSATKTSDVSKTADSVDSVLKIMADEQPDEDFHKVRFMV